MDPNQQNGRHQDTADPQLKVFIEDATKKTKTEVSGSDTANSNNLLLSKSHMRNTESTAR